MSDTQGGSLWERGLQKFGLGKPPEGQPDLAAAEEQVQPVEGAAPPPDPPASPVIRERAPLPPLPTRVEVTGPEEGEDPPPVGATPDDGDSWVSTWLGESEHSPVAPPVGGPAESGQDEGGIDWLRPPPGPPIITETKNSPEPPQEPLRPGYSNISGRDPVPGGFGEQTTARTSAETPTGDPGFVDGQSDPYADSSAGASEQSAESLQEKYPDLIDELGSLRDANAKLTADLAKAKATAYQEGADHGFTKGHNEGHRAGVAEGRDQAAGEILKLEARIETQAGYAQTLEVSVEALLPALEIARQRSTDVPEPQRAPEARIDQPSPDFLRGVALGMQSVLERLDPASAQRFAAGLEAAVPGHDSHQGGDGGSPDSQSWWHALLAAGKAAGGDILARDLAAKQAHNEAQPDNRVNPVVMAVLKWLAGKFGPADQSAEQNPASATDNSQNPAAHGRSADGLPGPVPDHIAALLNRGDNLAPPPGRRVDNPVSTRSADSQPPPERRPLSPEQLRQEYGDDFMEALAGGRLRTGPDSPMAQIGAKAASEIQKESRDNVTGAYKGIRDNARADAAAARDRAKAYMDGLSEVMTEHRSKVLADLGFHGLQPEQQVNLIPVIEYQVGKDTAAGLLGLQRQTADAFRAARQAQARYEDSYVADSRLPEWLARRRARR